MELGLPFATGTGSDATPDQVTANIPATNAPNGKIFARLKATK